MTNFFEKYKQEQAERKADMAKRNPDNLPTKFQVIIRMVVGVYLYYLIYSMYKTPEFKATSGWSKVLMIAAMVLFAVAGAWVFIKGLKGYRAGKFFDPNNDDYSEEAVAEREAEEAEAKAKEAERVANGEVKEGSMASFARLTSASQVSEEEQNEAYEAAKEENERK